MPTGAAMDTITSMEASVMVASTLEASATTTVASVMLVLLLVLEIGALLLLLSLDFGGLTTPMAAPLLLSLVMVVGKSPSPLSPTDALLSAHRGLCYFPEIIPAFMIWR
jgi:hypothetical protein